MSTENEVEETASHDVENAADEAIEDKASAEAPVPGQMSALNKAVAAAAVLLGIILVSQLFFAGETPQESAQATATQEASTQASSAPAAATPAQSVATASTNVAIIDREAPADGVNVGGIERRGEGRYFYTTIKVPANAESLYLSGSGASPLEDGSWGDMEQQVTDTFESFKQTLEGQGWSMGDIVQVRAFALSDEFGYLDFDGFNRGYSKFFGSEENPLKPVRTFVEIQDLVVPGWLIEIEIRAARVR
jgi:enamine deaminase RidA (YjgF/YER057c/UK114 family)